MKDYEVISDVAIPKGAVVVDSKSGGQAGRLEILGQELMCGPGQTFPLPPGNLGFVLQAFH